MIHSPPKNKNGFLWPALKNFVKDTDPNHPIERTTNIQDNSNAFPNKSKSNPSLITAAIYMWSVFLALVLVSAIAQILYPSPFYIWTNTISEQGSISLNPNGSTIWRIGVTLNGLAHIPYLLYLSHHFRAKDSMKGTYFAGISVISAIGFSAVGLFPQDWGAIHYISALVAFVGYYIAANFSFSTFLKKSRVIHRSNTLNWLELFRIYFNISGAACLFSFVFNKLVLGQEVSAILEWNYLLAICLWLLTWPPMLRNLSRNSTR